MDSVQSSNSRWGIDYDQQDISEEYRGDGRFPGRSRHRRARSILIRVCSLSGTKIGSCSVRESLSRRADFRWPQPSCLQVMLLDVSYTGAELDARENFTRYTEVSAGIFRQVDDRNEVSARIIGSEYVAGNLNENVTKTTFGVEGTFARSLVRDWSFYLTGWREP